MERERKRTRAARPATTRRDAAAAPSKTPLAPSTKTPLTLIPLHHRHQPRHHATTVAGAPYRSSYARAGSPPCLYIRIASPSTTHDANPTAPHRATLMM